jgi:hypothetical protein
VIGIELGERFLKIIFDNALRQGVEEVYVTIFPHSADQERLIRLLQELGFSQHGTKTGQYGTELVLVRNMTPAFDVAAPALTFPHISMNGEKEPFVLVGSAISLAFFLTSISISHLSYLREGEARSMWHFGRIDMGIVGAICTVSVFLFLVSIWVLRFFCVTSAFRLNCLPTGHYSKLESVRIDHRKTEKPVSHCAGMSFASSRPELRPKLQVTHRAVHSWGRSPQPVVPADRKPAVP